MKREIRYFPVELRVREASEGDAPEGVLEGYASVFDVEYRVGWGIKEQIAQGAFKDALAERAGVLPLFYMHDTTNPIGYALATEDDHGLHVEAYLFVDLNERARSVYAAAAAGALREWSIGYYLREFSTKENDDGTETDTVTEAEVVEASVVVKGANPATEMIAVRSEIEEDRLLAFGRAVAALARAELAEQRQEPEVEIEEPEAPTAPAHLLDRIESEHARALLRERFAANESRERDA